MLTLRALESVIWQKRGPKGLKSKFCALFMKKRTAFPIWGRFQASCRILRSRALESAIRPKRAPHSLKSPCCVHFMESALFSRFEDN